MKVSEFKEYLFKAIKIGFELPNGKLIPAHYNMAELLIRKDTYVDKDKKINNREYVILNFKNLDRYNHRLNPNKILELIEKYEEILPISQFDIEVAYFEECLKLYHLEIGAKYLKLINTVLDYQELTANQHKTNTPLVDAAADPSLPGNGCC
ncbi:DUF6428 family protein [Leeuwenhoekiella aequorea]|uniref:Uncharacterized protein n=1 Tax=Leeuwenhoekiella aequorea TaxID=283736 RepID=A0A4Q0PB05_9FLAO|nr:DUF6428 family protein [Leeuwenhoekiella aequorea]RXG23506.1 hypothetical protein DSM00_1120 [Leeuwenhoekiella aequorea]